MRKSRQESAETRRRIVEAASLEFRSRGISGAGVADVMAAAGLTQGGFYKHFESKEHVVEESLTFALESMVEAMANTLAATPGKRGLQKGIADYLSLEYRDDVANGCPFVALAGEVARSSESVRDAMTTGFVKMAELIAGRLEMPAAAARKEALTMLSTMIGAVTMARVVTDPSLSASILEQARKHLARLS
ncbi:TetR/AcrR family transcriptional regulator [Luteibacter aegosomatis]|uniref:TetR/AcrR family transcriptional regulator n=1 Tax=Luteibacter aegosomatis TaxID=2911537 RepID=UPI001FF8F008|nr:TetR/AcrR family transcriptional regulator [Luteibacter aegosomatis]UPG84061.1 TetR/AcrR family transcriptional regulator [Luteibacter aegosomatis]